MQLCTLSTQKKNEQKAFLYNNLKFSTFFKVDNSNMTEMSILVFGWMTTNVLHVPVDVDHVSDPASFTTRPRPRQDTLSRLV